MRNLFLSCFFFFTVIPVYAQYQMEYLTRGSYAINSGNGSRGV
jgi:cobalamin synthase